MAQQTQPVIAGAVGAGRAGAADARAARRRIARAVAADAERRAAAGLVEAATAALVGTAVGAVAVSVPVADQWGVSSHTLAVRAAGIAGPRTCHDAPRHQRCRGDLPPSAHHPPAVHARVVAVSQVVLTLGSRYRIAGSPQDVPFSRELRRGTPATPLPALLIQRLKTRPRPPRRDWRRPPPRRGNSPSRPAGCGRLHRRPRRHSRSHSGRSGRL